MGRLKDVALGAILALGFIAGINAVRAADPNSGKVMCMTDDGNPGFCSGSYSDGNCTCN